MDTYNIDTFSPIYRCIDIYMSDTYRYAVSILFRCIGKRYFLGA